MSRFSFRRSSDQPSQMLQKNKSFSFRRPAPQFTQVNSSSRAENFGMAKQFKAIASPVGNNTGGFMFSAKNLRHNDVTVVSKSTGGNARSTAFSFEDSIPTTHLEGKAVDNPTFGHAPKQPSDNIANIPDNDNEQILQQKNVDSAPALSEIPRPRVVPTPFSPPSCENKFASPITPAVHTKNVNIELSESQPERNKKTQVQEKERALLADSFSEGVAQLSEMNSKMDSLKKTVRELTFAATKVHNGILRIADTDLASTINMMKDILKSSTSSREQCLSSKDETHLTESSKMTIDEPNSDSEAKTDDFL